MSFTKRKKKKPDQKNQTVKKYEKNPFFLFTAKKLPIWMALIFMLKGCAASKQNSK